MSREVRRVPLGWKHPTEPNPYWAEQRSRRIWRGSPESRLHAPELQFVGLCDDYPGALATWEQESANVANRTGFDWTWNVEYHLTGYKGSADETATVHPFYVWSEDGETEIPITVRDEDHLHELLTTQKQGERPDPADYMPVFDQPANELGWCLYETVSEGTPVTPVFATADELIDHLATVGQDWDQQPMRRAAAAALVRQSGSIGSFVVVGGQLFNASDDADLLAERFAAVSVGEDSNE